VILGGLTLYLKNDAFIKMKPTVVYGFFSAILLGGLAFNSLYTITNMPINRFKLHLDKSGQFEAYMEKLLAAFNPAAAAGVMCRSLISVGHDGRIYDCDFNQMLELGAESRAGKPLSIFDFDFDALLARPIRFDEHCFGCTAGAGSSCGGATA